MPASAATRNAHLSNYASGVSQDRMSALAEFIAPVVPTGIAHGQYKQFNEKNDFQIYDTNRAIGGPRNRIEFLASDPYFNATPQGLETTIDDHERDLAGERGLGRLQEAKISNLIGACHHSHEKKVFDLIKAGKAATGSIGVWSTVDGSVEPIDEIDSQIEAIATEIGRMPNRIVFGLGAWRVFRNHPRVINRTSGVTEKGVSTGMAASMLLNPSMEIRVGVLSADSKKMGAAKTATNIVGAEVFIFYADDSPTQYDPSFAKTFSVDAGMIDSVREYREERNASDIYYVDWSEDIKVTSAASGRRITLS